MSLVGSYVALSKPLAAVLPVLLLAWMRFGIGGIAMLHWLKKPANEPPLTPETKRLLFLESFLGNFLFTICMIYGVSLTDAVSAGVTMAAIPAAVALMGWAFLGERVAPRTWMAVLCAVVGIALFSLSKPEHAAHMEPALGAKNTANHAWWGQMLLLGAVVCEAAYTVIGKKLTGSLGPKRITSLINLWGFVLTTPFGLYLALDFPFASVGWGTWVLLAAVLRAGRLHVDGVAVDDRAQGRARSARWRVLGHAAGECGAGGGAVLGRGVDGHATGCLCHRPGQRAAGHPALARGAARGAGRPPRPILTCTPTVK